MDTSRTTLADLLVSEQRSKGEEIMRQNPETRTEGLVLASLLASLVPTVAVVGGFFVALTGTPAIGLPILGAGIISLVPIFFLSKKAEKVAERFREGKILVSAADQEARERIAQEAQAYYGVSALDPELIPLTAGERKDVTVYQDGSPRLLTLLFPTASSPLTLLESSEIPPHSSIR